ncbi:MAG: HAMP domain-containing histidine kinase [Ardenticatenaceae bacterium]|nr:HAMP domain-containing histidine kinase [Anaerolineales bacterium]MCB8921448.1 HAMP domain-containing histidine kinase [Ardenticatenaceae bacterium]MCB8991565.1 HAMP domain-containing histidine kinase [Ardenticatenaceae bacterium]
MITRSLTLKLTLAFLFVGLSGAAFMALLVQYRTQTEFERFVLDNSQQALLDNLRIYYETFDSWEGVDYWYFHENGQRFAHNGGHPLPFTLLDNTQIVVLPGPEYQQNQLIDHLDVKQWIPLDVDGATVGYLHFTTFERGDVPVPLPASPEEDFLSRINTAVGLSALGATAVALLLGALLARTLTRPIHQLTAATQIVAKGELGHQVEVKARDELGTLADSFNQMSADLARTNQSRRQMTADIAHDLRTPLSVILGYTEALSDGKLSGSPDMYAVMHKEAQQLQRLIEDLRTLSLADAGELPLNIRETNVAELLEQIAHAYQVQVQEKGVALHTEIAADVPDVPMDPDRIMQVLGNLVSNALRYTPAGGTVTLGTAVQEQQVQLTIRDTGAGIAAADLPHIFERFYRGEKSRSQQEDESGLGLAIAKSLVEAHGGTISAASQSGEGSVFTITLPVGE